MVRGKMEVLKELLRQVDDDYLIGLCNKGTVKRAYKDLAQEEASVEWQENEAKVTLKEESCVIKMPLGESTCSCPSRSVCRHMITAILWLRQEVEAEGGEQSKEGKAEEVKEPVKEEPRVLSEVLEIPLERLKKVCKGKRFEQFLAHMRFGELPPLEESSIVTVTLPWEKATVKLLEPFAYSTCSCHSKELCVHKAQAVLAYQIVKQKIRLEDLEVLREDEAAWDEEQVRKAAKSVCESIVHQMETGLSRQSLEIAESLERLAVITHRAGLPSLESQLRGAASEYRQYFSRSAAFRNELLFEKILRLYAQAERLANAKGKEEIRPWAGTFRDAYEPAGTLHLLGMGGRTFSSKSGYEGEIYYFLEPKKGEWYTWTDARPVFYEGVRRRPPAASEYAIAPWGLNCNREQLQSLDFKLVNAKAASGGRLSVSQETKGEVYGTRDLRMDGLKERIVWDYEELLFQNFGEEETTQNQMVQNKAAGRKEKLVLAGAVGFGKTEFDTVEQKFFWRLFDREGRSLLISLRYTKEEKLTIQLLERLEKRLKKDPPDAIVFFGAIYLDEEGRMCLYPIEFFLKGAEEIAAELGEKGDIEKAEERKIPSMEIVRGMEQYRREAVRQLTDLFVSGISSVQEDVVRGVKECAEEAERLGLHLAGREFGKIGALLEGKRHRMEFEMEEVLRAAEKVSRYLEVCRRKLGCDMAWGYLREGES